ncbi:MAG TPA: hypothetical protein VMS98_06095 [Thermoanaerobaculia bacterium]|nr:hypothetical protein [Thermoanaerobaculia bacterium]
MSRVSGEKARAAITRRRRTAQRVKDRLARAAAFAKPAATPKAKAKRKAKAGK